MKISFEINTDSMNKLYFFRQIIYKKGTSVKVVVVVELPQATEDDPQKR